MKRWLYGTTTADRLAFLIHHAHFITVYAWGSTVPLWNWNDGITDAEGKQVAPLEIEVESDQELAKLEALILELKGS